MAIDWDRHFGRIEAEIASARCSATNGAFAGLPARHRLECETLWIRTLAAMLASRHIPVEARVATPAIPWQSIARLARYVEWCIQAGEPLPASVIDDFNRRAAPRLVPALRELRERLSMTNADGNKRSGILEVSTRGAFAHVVVRVPAGALDQLRACMARLYEGHSVPTLHGVRAHLEAASARLRSLGVMEIAVYGSVAMDCASPASDVDLAYRTRDRLDFQCWAEMAAAFEDILLHVVDAHLLDATTSPPAGAIVVWQA